MKQKGSLLTLIVCVLGLYGSFLSWSVLQERINTKPYGVTALGEPVYYKAPLVIAIVQALFAGAVGFVYCVVATKRSPFAVFGGDDAALYWRTFTIIAVTASLSAPLGYQSLKHVDYLAYLLAKSCKLIPVMLVHLALYRTRFPMYKYVVASLVTFGVVVFTMAHTTSSKTSINDGQTALGMAQLVGSMLLDGLTNSTQDQLFRRPGSKVSGASLMCILNVMMCVLTGVYALVFAYDSEFVYTARFIQEYPGVLVNILAFAVFGAVGQVFVFVILEKFDLLVLITATVTRKMISMMLSVVLFGHYLNSWQWCGVGLVFGGIGYEAVVKGRKEKKE